MTVHTVTPTTPAGRSVEFGDFLLARGVNPNETYQVDLDLSARPQTMTVHRYRRDDTGRFYVDDGEIATQEPEQIALVTEPPGPLS